MLTNFEPITIKIETIKLKTKEEWFDIICGSNFYKKSYDFIESWDKTSMKNLINFQKKTN